MLVKKIDRSIAKKIVEAKHYSRKLGIFWEAFGLFQEDVLVGVIVYGQPSAPIQKHSFKDRDFRLYELSRLVVDSGIKNGASFLIGNSLKMLSQNPCAVISYSDTSYGHSGIVYQATNWIYTGATVSHDKLYKVGEEMLHPMSIRDRFNVTEISKWAKENGIETISPKEKHRYFYLVGNKYQKRNMLQKLNYPIVQNYPKSQKTLYQSDLKCSEILGALF